MTPGLRAKIFNIIDWLVENEATGYVVCKYCGATIDTSTDEVAIDIPADKIDEAVEKIIELMKKDLDRDKEEK